MDSLDYWNSKETKTVLDNNNDSEDAEDLADHMLSVGSGAHAVANAGCWLQVWMRDMLAVCSNIGHYNLQIIKPYLAQVYRAITPLWLWYFRASEGLQQEGKADGSPDSS